MMKLLMVMLLAKTMVTKSEDTSPAGQQIVKFKEKTKGPIGIMTTSAGAPIEYRETNTLNTKLIFNNYFMDSLTHHMRERIPERVVHAKAAGAFGYFEVTHDITDICKADLFSAVGKKTSVAARFSPGALERGGIDTSRDARGFAVKFYTEDGNFDILGFSAPVFFFKDPLLFPSMVRAQRKNPETNLFDGNMMWDAITLNPEVLHLFLWINRDGGIPKGYRHMPGFSIHTYEVINKNGDKNFCRWHFTPDAGFKYLQSEEATKIAGEDPDYATRDLYNAIGSGNYPSWTLEVQALTLEQVKSAEMDVFDITKVLPLDKYPKRPVGRLVLNRNPTNYFAEIEQLAFCPGNLVPGILGAPDKVFEARRLAYRDAQNYRLGVNFNKIDVNCPLRNKNAFAYNRDGWASTKGNGKDSPNYYPNSFNGPVPYTDEKWSEPIEIYEGKPNNFEQARDLYTNGMTKGERSRVVQNFVDSLRPVTRELQVRALKALSYIHMDLSYRIQQGLQANVTNCSSEN